MNRKLVSLMGMSFDDRKTVLGVDFSVKSVFIELTDENTFRYDVTLSASGESMSIPYFMGSAHCKYRMSDGWAQREVQRLNGKKRASDGTVFTIFDAIDRACYAGPATLAEFELLPPTVDEILWTLTMDSYVTECESVNEFVRDYGYSEIDFDKALSIWNEVHYQTRKFERLLRNSGLTIDDMGEEYQDY